MTPSERLEALFSDGGRGLLQEAGLGTSWAEALRYVPPEVVRVADGKDGVALLQVLRDFYAARSHLKAAMALTQFLLSFRRNSVGDEDPDTLLEVGTLGWLAGRGGRTNEAIALLERALAGLDELRLHQDLRVAVCSGYLARLRMDQGAWVPAERLLQRSYKIRLSKSPQTSGGVAAQLAEVRLRLGRRESAIEPSRDAWLKSQSSYGAHDLRTLARARQLGVLLCDLDRASESLHPLRQAYDAAVELGDGSQLAELAFVLGMALYQCGVREESLRLVGDSVRWTRSAGGPHPDLPRRLGGWARLLGERGGAEQVEGVLREALEAETTLFGPDSVEVGQRYAGLGALAARNGRIEEAMGWLEAGVGTLRATAGDGDSRTRKAATVWVDLVLGQARTAGRGRGLGDASSYARQAAELTAAVLGEGDSRIRELRAVAEGGSSR